MEAGDGGIVALAGNLVDLVDEDDASLGPGHVVVCGLKQTGEDALHVLAHISGLGQHGSVDDGEGNVEHAGDGPGQKSLAGTGGADKQDVGLLQFQTLEGRFLGIQDFIGLALAAPLGRGIGRFPGKCLIDPLVVVVHCHGQGLLGIPLPYHVLVQESGYLLRCHLQGLARRCLAGLMQSRTRSCISKYVVSENRMYILRHPDGAVHTDRAAAPLEQHLHLIGGTAAEGAPVYFLLITHLSIYFAGRERILSAMP